MKTMITCQSAIEAMEKMHDFTGIHDLKFVRNKTQFEYAAKALLNCRMEFAKVSRISPYIAPHDISGRNDCTNREEEMIGFEMASKQFCFDDGSVAVDFQVPLKNKRADKGLGKVDVLAYNAVEKKICFMELKRPDNKETILRCALEAYAYSRIVDSIKLISDWRSAYRKGVVKIDVADDAQIVPCALIFKGGVQDSQFGDPRNECTRRLLKKLGIAVVCIDGRKLSEALPSVREYVKVELNVRRTKGR